MSAETLHTVGLHRIERGAGAHSFVLHLSMRAGESASRVTVRCLPDERALIVRVAAPAGGRFASRQTITVWSDKAPASDVVLNGDPSGEFGTLAMNESAGLEADAAFMTLFETIVTAEEHISYSIGGEPVTLDATHLQAARARFAELCARRAD